MASFPANVCGGGCKRLQEWLQTFAGTFAMLCVREGQNWHRNRLSYSGYEKREERFTIWGTVVLPKNLLNRFDVGPCMIYDKCGKKQTKVAPCANNLRL